MSLRAFFADELADLKFAQAIDDEGPDDQCGEQRREAGERRTKRQIPENTEPGAELTPETLIAWARESMSNYKVPRRVFVVPELPLTSNGKVDKAALRARALEAV